LPAPQGRNPIKKFVCNNSPNSVAKEALDAVANAGAGADYARPLAEAGAALAGAAKGADMQAASIMGAGLAQGLRAVGQVGQVATGFALAYDLLITQDLQAAAFDATDFGVYGGLSALGAAGAFESGGSSVFLARIGMWKYYDAGGSKGLVQSWLCQ
jgi:hypothetical protein